MSISGLMINGGIAAGKMLIDWAANNALEWGSGEAWKIVKNMKQSDPICAELYDVVQKCVLGTIKPKGNSNNLLEIDSVSMACELVYKSLVESGDLDDNIYRKVKLALQSDSISIGSKKELMNSLENNIILYKNSSLYKYLLIQKFDSIKNDIKANQKKQAEDREVVFNENQYLELMNSLHSHERSINNTVNDILINLQDENSNVGRLYLLTRGAIADKTECSKFYDFINVFEDAISQIEDKFNKKRIEIPAEVSGIIDRYFYNYQQYFLHARYLVSRRDNQDDEYKRYSLQLSHKMQSLSIEKHKETVDSISRILNKC